MQILVVGGSNSLLKDGYIYHFARKMTDEYGEVEIVNRSVGGTTSLTSLALLDTLESRPDLIILEYSLNDTGHINHLADAYQKKQEMLEKLYGFMAVKFKDVPVLPLLLASDPFYDISVVNNVYKAEKDFCKRHGLIHQDMRVEFHEYFGGQKPSFLYSDLAHFHRGFASALIGRPLAQSAQRILSMPKGTNVYQSSSDNALAITHAATLSYSAGLTVERAANRHLQLDCIVVGHDTSALIELPGWPVCLYIASDILHTDLSLEINGQTFEFATIHCDCQEGKLIFTSVPLFLNERFVAIKQPGPTRVRLSLSRGAEKWTFDCLKGESDASPERRVRIAAIATE